MDTSFTRRAILGALTLASQDRSSAFGAAENRPRLRYGIPGSYFNLNPSERVPQLPARVPDVHRIDRQVSFDWGRRGPFGSHGRVGSRNFGVHWEGYLHIPQPGLTTLYAAHHGGMRWTLDGETIYDRWLRSNAQGAFISRNFDRKGWLPFAVDFHSHGGRAAIRLEWGLPGNVRRTLIEAKNFAHLASSEPEPANQGDRQ